MTHYALRILAFPDPTTNQDLESASLDARVVQGLAAHAADCGPYGLSRWAKPRGHTLYWVDNSWVRAQVRGRDLPAFFAEVLKAGARVDPRFEPAAAYFIEAEEY